MRRKKGGKMLCHSDRPNSRAAAAVRNTKRFMEIEVAGIDAKFAGATDADQGIEVGTIHINLAARLVNFFAYISDSRLEDTVGGGIGDHGGGDSRSVLFEFCIEVGKIDVPLRVACDRNDPKTDEDRTGWIGAVCGNGNEADITCGVSSGLMPSADREKACVLSLGARVRLEGDMGQAGDFA
jgi:hypothetical protein